MASYLGLFEYNVYYSFVFQVVLIFDDRFIEAVGKYFVAAIVKGGCKTRACFVGCVGRVIPKIPPAGERARKGIDVRLGIVGVIARSGEWAFTDGKQLQELTGVVLVYPGAGILVAV